jgi:hypothetical protein
MFKTRKFFWSLVLLLGLNFWLGVLAAKADNCDVPRELFSYRDKLLRNEQELRDTRADLISHLNEWDQLIRQGDARLRENPPNRQEILFYRDKLIADIRRGDGLKESIEKRLLENNDNLRRIESEINRYAAYR